MLSVRPVYFTRSQTNFYDHIQGSIKSKWKLNAVIHLFCKFTLSKIYTKLIQRTEGLMVVTRCNYVYVNLLNLVESLEDCKIIKLLESYLYKTTAHNSDACPNGKPQMKYAWAPIVVNGGW